jgi:hypothetical protein
MTPVAIRERVDLGQPMMQTRGHLVGRIGLVFDPEAYVIEHGGYFRGDSERVDTNVDFLLPVRARPFPDFAEQLLV